MNVIQTALERSPREWAGAAPEDWAATQSVLRELAADLLICPDVEKAITKPRADRSAMLFATILATELEDSIFLATMQRAYAATPHATEILPGQAFAEFLLQLAAGPAPKWSTT